MLRGSALPFVLAALIAAPVAAGTHRSKAERAAFQREHPCPSTGKPRGRCPGYVVDHIKPLCAGGPDKPWNMQWQSIADAKAKDRGERAQCAKR